jgi:hypothetical protein
MEEYTKDFLQYVDEIKEKFHPIEIPAIDVLFILYKMEQINAQDEETTNKKSKK